MKIHVNARFLTQEVTGTQRFAINISRELKKLRPETVFLAPPGIRDKHLAKELGVTTIGQAGHFLYRKLKLPANLLWEQVDLPLVLEQLGSPPLLNLVNMAPFFYANNFLTIHDLAFKLRPNDFSRRFILLYNLLLPCLARRARQVFTVSNFSKKTLEHHFRLPPGKVTVIYNAVRREYWQSLASSGKPPYRQPFILAVGSLEPRKNLKRLIEAFLQLELPDILLVIVGSGNPQVFKASDIFPKNFDKADKTANIIITGYLEDQQLASLYRHATCFCYPSLFEGFGLPPLEAQALECPVLVSNRTSLPEIFGDSALYCNPERVDDIKSKLEKLLQDKSLRRKLIQKGKNNIKRFAWEKSARIISHHITSKLRT